MDGVTGVVTGGSFMVDNEDTVVREMKEMEVGRVLVRCIPVLKLHRCTIVDCLTSPGRDPLREDARSTTETGRTGYDCGESTEEGPRKRGHCGWVGQGVPEYNEVRVRGVRALTVLQGLGPVRREVYGQCGDDVLVSLRRTVRTVNSVGRPRLVWSGSPRER